MSSSEFIVVIIAILILFGGKRLPELARTWGRRYRELQYTWYKIRRQIELNDENLIKNADETPKEQKVTDSSD